MKKIVIGSIIAVIAIITLVLVWGTGFGATPYYETETEFGMWQEELYVIYEDGTEHSLKILDENMDKPFAVTYGGQVITEMGIKISATVSGTGFDGAEIKSTGFGVTRQIKTASGTLKKTYNAMRTDRTIQWPIGSASTSLINTAFDVDDTINQHPGTYPTGTYKVWFIPFGTIEYRGYPDGGDWKNAALPSTRTASISVTQTITGSILVTLGSEITT